jgi:hypothetical protein
MTNLLTDQQIRAIQAQHPTDNDPRPFARAIIAATVAKLTAGVSVEPDSYKVETEDNQFFTEFEADTVDPATNDDAVVTPLYTADAIAAAHQAGRKSVHDKCVDLWKDEFLAAARVAALEEAAKVCESEAWRLKSIAVSQQSAATNSKSIGLAVAADKIRALIGKEST